MSERESREFFYVEPDGSRVRKVVGFICEGTPGYWRCPEIGYSAAEGYSLFRDRVDAYNAAFARAQRTVDIAQANLDRIEAERWADSPASLAAERRTET